MRRSLLRLMVVAVSALIVVMMAVTAGAALGQANPDTINERIPVTGEIAENSCTGEPITITGTLHILRHSTADADEGHHGVNQSNLTAHGVSPSGAKYVIVIGDHISGTFQADTGMTTQTNAVPTKFLRQGEDGTTEEDFMSRSVFHITLQPDGEFTAVVENFDFECK